MKNVVLWDVKTVTIVRTDVSQEHIASIIMETRRVFLHSILRFLFNPNVLTSPTVILMIEAIRSPQTSILTTATRRNIPKDDILHSHCRENLKSYIALTGWSL
jgi:hypothetical protein